MSKKILITGCSTGFGFDAARYFAKRGDHVYATMRGVGDKNASAASALKEFALSEGLELEVLELDVTSDQSVAAAVARIPEIDVLINNAGIGFSGPVEGFTSQEFTAQLDINVVGAFRVANAVLPKMRARKSGLIIQVSSVGGRSTVPGYGLYHASKWALEGLSESMRYELAALGIDVVIVEPGPFSTNFIDNTLSSRKEEFGSDYNHVNEYVAGLKTLLRSVYENDKVPTDPKIVAEAFGQLVDMPNGQRPLRTIAGHGPTEQKINDAVEPIRQALLKKIGMADWDGPQK